MSGGLQDEPVRWTLLPHAVGFAEEMRLDWDDHGDRYSRAVFDEQSYEMRYDVEPPSRERTSIMYDPNGGGFVVVGPNGQPVQLPETEDCQRLTRCCEAAGRLGGSVSLTCGMATATSRDGDCQSGLAAVRELVAGPRASFHSREEVTPMRPAGRARNLRRFYVVVNGREVTRRASGEPGRPRLPVDGAGDTTQLR